MDLTLRMDRYNAQDAFDLTYKSAKENIPSGNYDQLTDSSNAYRHRMLSIPAAFNEQLPFYAVKPLYIALIYLFYKSGISLAQATLVPSFMSYLLIGLLLFHWIGAYLRLPVALAIALLIMISSPLIEVAKLSTPDCLSSFLLLSSFYFVLEKPSLLPALLFMILSVCARLDNIVTCFLILGIVCLSKKWYRKISFKKFFLIIILFVLCYFLVGLTAYQYHWSFFFYNDFLDHLHPEYGSKEHFSFGSYLRLMYEHTMSGINHSYLVIFMALLFLGLHEGLSFKALSFDKLFALCIPVILFIRFILYPDISDRFYIAFYLIIIVLLIKTFRLRAG